MCGVGKTPRCTLGAYKCNLDIEMRVNDASLKMIPKNDVQPGYRDVSE